VFKKWLTTFANQVDFHFRIWENESTHRLKFETAGYIICEAEQVDPIQADTAAQLAVYAIKG
jgi:3-phenylpropionate/cinnamic acid dioxygenase small subunit